jgi:hypothetical protein
MLAHLVGGEDLPADGLVHHPGHRIHGLPLQVVIALADRAGVNADTDLDGALRVRGVVLLQGLLDGNRGPDRSHSGRKGDKESVPQRIAYVAPKRSDLVTHDGCLQTEDFVGVPVATRSAQCGRADNIGHHDRERIGRPAAIRQRLPPIQLLKPRTCPSEYGGLSGRSLHRTCAWCPGPGTPQFQVTLGLARIPPARTPLDVRPPLQAFGLGGVAGHPKGAIGRQRLVEQLGGLLLVSSATTVEQHPGSQAA